MFINEFQGVVGIVSSSLSCHGCCGCCGSDKDVDGDQESIYNDYDNGTSRKYSKMNWIQFNENKKQKEFPRMFKIFHSKNRMILND